MAQREVLAGAVLDLHNADDTIPQPTLAEMLADIRKLALDAVAERDAGIRLLRRSLELSEIGSEGPFKTDVRAYLARLGQPTTITRTARKLALEREIVLLNPETDEAFDLLEAFTRALRDRYGDDRTIDLRERLNEVGEALSELEARCAELSPEDR